MHIIDAFDKLSTAEPYVSPDGRIRIDVKPIEGPDESHRAHMTIDGRYVASCVHYRIATSVTSTDVYTMRIGFDTGDYTEIEGVTE